MKKTLLATIPALTLVMAVAQANAYTISYGGQNMDNYVLSSLPANPNGDGSGLTSTHVSVTNNVQDQMTFDANTNTTYYVETFDKPNSPAQSNVGLGVGTVDIPAGAGFTTVLPSEISVLQGSFAFANASVVGVDAAPAGDSTFFVFAPKAGGSVDSTILVNYADSLGQLPAGSYISYIGIYYGSIDAYNNLVFYNGNTKAFSILGTDVITGMGGGADSEGNWTSPISNVYVNIAFDPNDTPFTSFGFSTTGIAFEGDNIVVGITTPSPVPEPATMLLFGTGLIGLAGIGRRKLRK